MQSLGVAAVSHESLSWELTRHFKTKETLDTILPHCSRVLTEQPQLSPYCGHVASLILKTQNVFQMMKNYRLPSLELTLLRLRLLLLDV